MRQACVIQADTIDITDTVASGSPSFQNGREPVYFEREGKFVVTLVLNNPERLNAITAQMWRMLHQFIHELSSEDSLRCIVIRGSGGKAFSSGCDIHEFGQVRSNKKQARDYGMVMHDTLVALQNCPVPLVASIEGICVGAGLQIASTCDFRICNESARFGAPIKHPGLVMAYPEPEPLIELSGKDVVMEILPQGRIFNAVEAKERRLVTRVVPDSELEESVNDTVRQIVSGVPLAACWHKRFIRKRSGSHAINNDEKDKCFDCFDTEDFQTGYRAFLKHEAPGFRRK